MNLPDISGYEVCRRLKADPATASTPGAAPVGHLRRRARTGARGWRAARTATSPSRWRPRELHRHGAGAAADARGGAESRRLSLALAGHLRRHRRRGVPAGRRRPRGAHQRGLPDPVRHRRGRDSPFGGLLRAARRRGGRRAGSGRRPAASSRCGWGRAGSASRRGPSWTTAPRRPARVRVLARHHRAAQAGGGAAARADELAEADRRKDEFLAMLAHELRNPLAAITQRARRCWSARPPTTPSRRSMHWRMVAPAGRSTWPGWWTTCWTSRASPAARSSCASEPVDLRGGGRGRRVAGVAPAARGAAARAGGRRCRREPDVAGGGPHPAGAGGGEPAGQRRQVHRAGRRHPADGDARGRRGRWCGCATPASASRAEMLARVFELFAQGDRSRWRARAEGWASA